ncbi:hypothetical protein AYL99_06810 [Fonsecaea erecta]|uniref:Dienelactone hydrolase domain-containing protein n=1 Tax=Fonsecaea erecta TaxID=1367422 RepID=A0A178ZIL3_9EURO|nr:hypothetical protein AYL99_06810 [Fonsecaea erecta]OAP59512.1 hypothetical protein AYL99_06810 [Fonsecaea erecta]
MADKEGYLAKPSGECCLKGSLHEGEPRGRTETVAGIETYISTPQGKNNGNIVLYFPDVWGFFNNGFLVMDGLADAGYTCIGLDYFRGDPVWKHRKGRDDPAPGFDYEAWKKKHIAFADEAVPGWVEAVKAKFGTPTTKFACVGYCFGAPYVCNELARDICTAGAFAHPAFLKETHFRQLKKPLFLSCAETDHTFGTDARNEAIKILQEDKKPYNLQLFSGVEHGFALRCNLDNPYERYAKEESLRAIAKWFDFWLTQ